jgi:Zn-dependent peptidase ImmA (M78 family)/DNA-binding XRE family transcriptional regulator
MNGQRLRQLRLARGMSLEELAAALGGLVTRQALWKYEKDKAQPGAVIANKLAKVLGVKTMDLVAEPSISVEFIAYRKRSSLTKTEQERIQTVVALALEDRVRLQQCLGIKNEPLPTAKERTITSDADAERVAEALRKHWNLGADAISNMVAVLEDHQIHVVEIDADSKFDGISAVAKTPDGEIAAAAVVVNRGIPGERQRLSAAHELAHLVLILDPDKVDEEAAAYRFGAAFLMPASTLRRDVGDSRNSLSLPELMLLKKRFGMSIQAILRRLCKDLGIISAAHYTKWCIEISKRGYRKNEPNEMVPEKPLWLTRSVLRAVSEDLMTAEEAKQMSSEIEIETATPLSLIQRRAFFQMPLAERQKMLAAQAEKMVEHYETDPDWKDLGSTDIVEY